MSIAQHLLAALVLAVGCAIQGSVGFGANLFAAPLLVLIDPGLVPGPVIISSLALNVLVMRREPGGRQVWREVAWPIAGQVPGTVAGAALLASVAVDDLTIFFGVLVLLAVGVTASGLHPRRTPTTLGLAGVLSGFMGTAVGIGGPPIALLYQKATGPQLRSAISRFFFVSGLTSVAVLAGFGQLGVAQLVDALWLVPGSIAGFLLSGRLRHHVDEGRVRHLVLGLSAASAVVAIVRTLW